MNILEYKGYYGSVEFDIEGKFLHGKLLFIKDVVSYESNDLEKIEKEFRDAVDDYLETCAELGDKPDTPCKGSLNIRIGHDVHLGAMIAATKQGVSLNDWIKQACELKLRNDNQATAQTLNDLAVHHAFKLLTETVYEVRDAGLQSSFEVSSAKLQSSFEGGDQWTTH